MGQEHSAPSSCSSGAAAPSRASLRSEAPLELYTNHHFRDAGSRSSDQLYRPLKLRGRVRRLQLLDADRETAVYLERHLSIKSDVGGARPLPEPPQKPGGIRNYTPKILSDKQPRKDLEHWI